MSVLSLFLPILRYRNGNSVINFNIIDLAGGSSKFEHYVVQMYSGPVIWNISAGTVSVLAIMAVAALACAIIGLVTLRAQRPNTKNFVLTIIGLLGILLPSITACVCILGFGQYYSGRLSLGITPIISPIAVLISIGSVVRRKKKVAEELRKEAEEKGLIQRAGDL